MRQSAESGMKPVSSIIVQSVRVSAMTGLTATGTESLGKVRIQYWSKADRTRRALKFLGLCWTLSLLTILLPIVHFVLVPGFFIAGPVGAYFFLQQESIVLGGEATCPQCQQPLPLERGRNEWPLTDLCSECQTNVKLEKTRDEKN